MHQQNIIFVFLQVLKLVMEITVKVKDFLRMQVRKPFRYILTICVYNETHNSVQNFILFVILLILCLLKLNALT